MRKLIAVAAVMTLTSAHAASALKFGDINYFLQKGEFNVGLDVNASMESQKFQGEKTEKRGNIFNSQLTYAYNDQFNVFLGLDYAYDLETENKTSLKDSDYSSDGFANPALGANYRFMVQSEKNYNVDFGAVARINVQDAETGAQDIGESNDGNFADGRNSLELNARIGRKWNEANEWQLALGTIYHLSGESTLKGVNGSSDVDEDSSIDTFLKASYQYRPINEFMMLVSAGVTRVNDFDSKIKGTGKIQRDAHYDIKLGFTAKYLVMTNLIAKFNYSVSNLPEYDVKVAGTSDDVVDRQQNSFGLGIDYLF